MFLGTKNHINTKKREDYLIKNNLPFYEQKSIIILITYL